MEFKTINKKKEPIKKVMFLNIEAEISSDKEVISEQLLKQTELYIRRKELYKSEQRKTKYSKMKPVAYNKQLEAIEKEYFTLVGQIKIRL